jgi:hypothetical protein
LKKHYLREIKFISNLSRRSQRHRDAHLQVSADAILEDGASPLDNKFIAI